MDRALIFGATGGIGAAVARALTARGVQVTGLSRADGLDVTNRSAVAAVAARITGPFDLIFNATGALTAGGPPEKTIAAVDPDQFAAQFALNATGVALLLRHFAPMLAGGGVFASLSARVGSIGDNRLGGWISYRAAKAAQNQILRTAAIEIARKNRGAVVVALHPGTVATSLTRDYAARHPTITPDQSAQALLAVIDQLTPDDNGTFWDWKGARVPW
ncbi:SDR family NAD(P)-dependent oxidoreductase [Paracoccus sp. (in: a-proteobacteria)]|uniref:SDR family NAD(P)-dependent oxidoreductase n=1 Tax=Paracoccus sp. TaxID=267 RepID=UPI0026DEE401|nr:SDR family NAD(P)-dependent oxidoreductase [Paracoccus sp. (in: a-proteobacteria)]MDO5648904.1 SDR family NAD(P)-dependent oxidoreductase [Paracoccus sp. (in: a-proteobacteria)]